MLYKIQELEGKSFLKPEISAADAREPGSTPLGGFKVDPVFNFSEVDKRSTRSSWYLSGKRKLPPRSGFLILKQLNPIHKKGIKSFFERLWYSIWEILFEEQEMNNAIVYHIYEYLVVYHRKMMLKIFLKQISEIAPHRCS